MVSTVIKCTLLCVWLHRGLHLTLALGFFCKRLSLPLCQVNPTSPNFHFLFSPWESGGPSTLFQWKSTGPLRGQTRQSNPQVTLKWVMRNTPASSIQHRQEGAYIYTHTYTYIHTYRRVYTCIYKIYMRLSAYIHVQNV